MAKGGSVSGDNGEGASFRGGEVSAATILDRGFRRLDQALGQLLRYFGDLQVHTAPPLPLNAARARNVARALLADVRRASDAAQRARRSAETLFKTELRDISSSRERKASMRQFQSRNAWCGARISETRQGLLTVIRRAQYWNSRLQHPSELLFPKLPPLPPPTIELVWKDLQWHILGGSWVPIRKAKFNFVFLGRKLNFALVSFPHFPDWKPKPKLLVSSGEATANGVTLHALDSIGPEVGNPVLPGSSTRPAIEFNGYLKIIYATGIPAGCQIQYRTVWYARWSFLPGGGGGGAWQDITPGGNAGGPRADPPGGGPNFNVAPGTTAFADFPGSWFLPGTAVCSYLVRNDLFRTWVILVCPTKTTILGYWEWSFRMVLHQGAGGVENITTQPDKGPAGVANPPGNWPAAPSSGPTSWVPAGSAPANVLADYYAAFP